MRLSFDEFAALEVNHIDRDKTNNVLENLELIPRPQHAKHTLTNPHRKSCSESLSKKVLGKREYANAGDAVKKLEEKHPGVNFDQSSIHKVCKKKNNHHQNYIFEYAKQPDLPNVPNAIDLAKSPEARALIEMGIHAPGMVNRYYTLPPKTPKDRVSILRKAFLAAFKDSAFLADAKKARLEIEPLTAGEVSKNMEALFSMKPPLAKKLKKIIARKAIR